MNSVTVLYRDRKAVYIETEYFCPKCGSKPVYCDDQEDYYVGVDYLCLNCKCKFNMPFIGEQDSEAILAVAIIAVAIIKEQINAAARNTLLQVQRP